MVCDRCGNVSTNASHFCTFCGNPTNAQPEHTGTSFNTYAAPGGYSTAARRAINEELSPEDASQSALPNLNQWMIELLHHLRSNVLSSCQQTIHSIQKEREDRATNNKQTLERTRAQIETRWQQSQRENQTRQNQSTAARNSARSTCASRKNDLRAAREKVNEHLGKLRVDPALPAIQGTTYKKDVEPLAVGEQYVMATAANIKGLSELNKPDFLWWNSQDIAIALIISLGIAGVLTSVSQPRTSDEGILVFVLSGGIVLAGLLSGFYVWRKYSLTTALAKHYGGFLQNESTANFWLDHYLGKAEETFKNEMAQQTLYLNKERAVSEAAKTRADEDFSNATAKLEAEFKRKMFSCKEEYLPRIDEGRRMCGQFYSTSSFAGANWADRSWSNWQPFESPALNFRIGSLSTGSFQLSPVTEEEVNFSVPAMLCFESKKSLLFESTGEPKKLAIDALQSIMLRLLAANPPGKLRFVLIDPVGLGQNVASFMALADHDDNLIGGKAWTEPRHIEQRLAEITEHMETVIQKYLRKDYETIESYNNQAGEVAEPYRMLVVVDFPVNFTADAARRLVSIAQNGARCGVRTIVVRDVVKPLPHGFNIKDLEQAATLIRSENGAFVWDEDNLRGYPFEVDEAPPNETLNQIVRQIGERAKSGMAVKVPYSKLLQMAELDPSKWWSSQVTTAEEIRTPLGPTGARKAQYLTMGKGMAHHSIIIGRTGSGKSNLMHVIITSLALTYSPDEIQLYLIDFKQGVEFKCYAEHSLPHAKVIAIQSEREFGISVLQGLDDQLKTRGDQFRAVGVENIANYRRKTNSTMARVLLVVDEFQEFFTYDDTISRNAAIILDRLVRQGRSAGIHVMMGSQTLAGHKLPTGLLGQMAIRIALQCSEADSKLILSDDNPAARLLSRPGEAYYNDQGGLVEANNLFQVALFTEQDRSSYLSAISEKAASNDKSYEPPIIFEGNEPARFENCKPIENLIQSAEWPARSKSTDAFLGEAIAIRPPTSARFRRQAGNNLLVVTREEEEGTGILVATILSIATQKRPDEALFFIVDLSTADTSWETLFEEIASLLPHPTHIARRRDIANLLISLATELRQRMGAERIDGPEIFVFVQGLQRARDLRPDESGTTMRSKMRGEEVPPAPSQIFMELLREGPDVGMHVVAWVDTVANALKIDRNIIRECGLRVGSRMSVEDSNKLFDDSVAAKLDKAHRAIFLDEERTGAFEKFRPYAVPDTGKIRFIANTLRLRSEM